MQIVQSRIRAGRWIGVIEGAGESAPPVEVVHLEQPLAQVSVTPTNGGAGQWKVEVPIPVDLLSDGVQTFVLRDTVSGEHIAHFTLITGIPMEDDIRAELDLLRAELDLLKKAFRRHCTDGEG